VVVLAKLLIDEARLPASSYVKLVSAMRLPTMISVPL
jgi:hypothetical protein